MKFNDINNTKIKNGDLTKENKVSFQSDWYDAENRGQIMVVYVTDYMGKDKTGKQVQKHGNYTLVLEYDNQESYGKDVNAISAVIY